MSVTLVLKSRGPSGWKLQEYASLYHVCYLHLHTDADAQGSDFKYGSLNYMLFSRLF